jgi:hypothetical protein
LSLQRIFICEDFEFLRTDLMHYNSQRKIHESKFQSWKGQLTFCENFDFTLVIVIPNLSAFSVICPLVI